MKQIISFVIVATACVVCSIALFAQGGVDQRAKTEAGLPIKLIVVKNDAFYVGGVKNVPLDPFTILFLYEPKDGEDGFYIFGTEDGDKVIGKIKKDFVEKWETRFGLFPRFRDGKPLLKINGNEIENIGANPPGIRQYAIVLSDERQAGNNKDEEKIPLPVCIFKGATTTIKEGGKREGNTPLNIDEAAREMTFDFVYVIDTTVSMEPLIEMAKSIADVTSAELRKLAAETQQKIRFGIVEYRDSTTPELGFVSRTSCRLSSNFDNFTKILGNLKCAEVGSIDTAEEVFAGLKTAIEDAGWEGNSKKHIILLGDAPAKGDGEKTTGMTGLSMKNIQDLLHQQDTGREALKGLKDWRVFTVTHQVDNPPDADEQEAARQFKLLAAKDDRYYNVVASDAASKQRTIAGLSKVLRISMDDADKLNKGGIFEPGISDDTGDMTTLRDDQIVQRGTTTIRDANDLVTAEKRMLLMRYEIKQLFAALQFFSGALKRNQSNPAAIVDALIQAVGGTAAGNTVTADTDIKEIIAKDFPFSLNLLKVTANDITKMPPERFEEWHNDLKELISKIDKLDKQESQWSILLYPDDYKTAADLDPLKSQYRFLHNDDIDTRTPIKK